jgi:hypothetical protein
MSQIENPSHPAPIGRPSPAAPRSSLGRIAWLTALAILFLYLLSTFVPWQPTFPPGALDISWCMALHWAFVHHVDFGNQFVFTFGPWGFVWQGYHPDTFNLVIAGWSLFSMAFFAGLLSIAHRLRNRIFVGFWMALVIGIAGAPITQSQDVRMFALCWLLLIVHFHTGDRAISKTTMLLAVAMALASLIKFSVCLIAWPAIILVSIDLLRRRRIPWVAMVYVAAFIAFWLGASQPIGSLPVYLRHSLQISSHYATGEAFSQPTEFRDVFVFALFGVMLLLLLLWASGGSRAVIIEKNQIDATPHSSSPDKADDKTRGQKPDQNPFSRLNTALAAAGLVCSWFIGFKAGFVRHDGHDTVASSSLSLLSLLYGAALWRGLDRWPRKTLMVVASTACVLLSWYSDVKYKRIHLPTYIWMTIESSPSHIQSAFQWIGGNTTNVQDTYQKTLAGYREAVPLPRVEGSVDIYSWEQRAVFANGLNYQPRPVIQSYLTLTPELEQLNADFLKSARAPDNILLKIETIDQRYPSEDDGLSWPLILTRYDLADAKRPMLLLRKTTHPRNVSVVPVATLSAKLNDWIGVPQIDDPVWVTIDIKPTIARSLCSMLYKPCNISLVVKTRDGAIKRMGIVPEMARAGFLLSPLVRDRWEFAFLGSPDWREILRKSTVTDISVSADTRSGLDWSYADDYEITFSSLQFEHRDISSVPGVGVHLRILKFIKDAKVRSSGAAYPVFTSEEEQIFLAPTQTQIVVPVTPGAKSVRLGFGIVDEPGDKSPPAGLTTFRAFAMDESALAAKPQDALKAGKLIWSRTLNPSITVGDRGSQSSEEIRLPDPAPAAILLETSGGNPNHTTNSFWSDVQFQ